MNDYQFFVFEGDSTAPSASGTAPNRSLAHHEMMHYVMMYGQDGSVRYLMKCDGETLISGTWDKHKVWKKGYEYMAMHEEL